MSEVSLVVPSYNESEILKDTLGHMGQVSDYFGDVYLADDGSTDGTGELAKQYVSERGLDVQVYLNEKNGGKVGAIQKVVEEEVETDYIFLMDADSWIQNPENVSDLLGFLEQENLSGAGVRVDPSVEDGSNYSEKVQELQKHGYAFGRLQHRITNGSFADVIDEETDEDIQDAKKYLRPLRLFDLLAAKQEASKYEDGTDPEDMRQIERYGLESVDDVDISASDLLIASKDRIRDFLNTREERDNFELQNPQMHHMPGAGMIMDTDVLDKALDHHSCEFDGEDMETTAITQLILGEDVGYFPDLTVNTRVPDSYLGIGDDSKSLFNQRKGWSHGALNTYAEHGEKYFDSVRDPRETLTLDTLYELGFLRTSFTVLGGSLAYNAAASGQPEILLPFYLGDMIWTGAGLEAGYRLGELEDRSYLKDLPIMPFHRAAAFFPGNVAAYPELARNISKRTKGEFSEGLDQGNEGMENVRELGRWYAELVKQD